MIFFAIAGFQFQGGLFLVDSLWLFDGFASRQYIAFLLLVIHQVFSLQPRAQLRQRPTISLLPIATRTQQIQVLNLIAAAFAFRHIVIHFQSVRRFGIFASSAFSFLELIQRSEVRAVMRQLALIGSGWIARFNFSINLENLEGEGEVLDSFPQSLELFFDTNLFARLIF